MGRIALGIEYDGAAVYGWQRQREVPSVQEHLEKAAMRMFIGNMYTFYYLYVTRDNIFGFY